MIKPLHVYAAGGALALLALVWLLRKGNAATLGRAAGGAVVNTAAGAVVGLADALGIPATDAAKGAAAVASGSVLDASLYLPAGDFVAALPTIAVNAANNPAKNPLQPLGSWLGYVLHPVAAVP